jgi:hypothetical protein
MITQAGSSHRGATFEYTDHVAEITSVKPPPGSTAC